MGEYIHLVKTIHIGFDISIKEQINRRIIHRMKTAFLKHFSADDVEHYVMNEHDFSFATKKNKLCLLKS